MAAIAVSTYTYLWRTDIKAALADVARAGFSDVELLAAPPHVDAGERPWAVADRIAKAAGCAGVQVNSVVPSGVDVNLASPDSSMRRWSVRYFGTIGRLAADIGARWLIIHPGRRHPLRPAPYDQYRQWVLDGIRVLLDDLSGVDIGVLFENTPTGILDAGTECAGLVGEIGPDRIGVCYDIANGHMVEDVHAGLAAVGRYLRLVHLSDTTRASWAHDPIGSGEIDFQMVAATVAALGYTGDVVIETLHDGDAAEGFTADVAALRSAGWPLPRPVVR